MVSKVKNTPMHNFVGEWENDLGSSMKIETQDMASGAIAGKYKTKVGRPADETEFELVGTVNGDMLSFFVNWGDHGSITAWVGQHVVYNGKDEIKTMWHLARNVEDDDEEESVWGSVLTGANTFSKK